MDARQSFDARPERLAEVRRLVDGFARTLAMSRDATDLVVLAVCEAATNAILHSRSPTFEVRLHSEDSILGVEIRDRGLFRGREETPGEGHYGFQLMRAAFDEVEVEEGAPQRPGTKVRLLKCL